MVIIVPLGFPGSVRDLKKWTNAMPAPVGGVHHDTSLNMLSDLPQVLTSGSFSRLYGKWFFSFSFFVFLSKRE